MTKSITEEMSKEDALKNFCISFKISLKNAYIYSGNHPAFIKSLEEVKKKIDLLFTFLSPVKIGFASHSLLIEEEYLENERIYEELAEIFHVRKIKCLEIKKGISVEELVLFLRKLYLSPKDILREGGLSNILKKEKVKYIAVEELDYSQLLKGEGEEVKDIWVYLLQDAVEREDIQKINEFVDDFERIIGEFEISDFIEDEQLWESMSKFFSYLKDKDKDKYRKCAKDFVKSILKAKNVPMETKFDKVKIFFSDLSDDDFASTLWEEIVTNKSFDSMSFNIFSDLIEREKHEGVANSLAEIIRREDTISNKPKIREKIRELFSDTSNPIVSKVYRRTLSFFLKSISFEDRVTFDKNLLRKNYRYVLIRLFMEDKRKDFSVSVLKKIAKELDNVINVRDLEFLKYLLEALNKRRGVLISEPLFIEVNKVISGFIEKDILNGEVSPEFDYFIDNMWRSSLDVNVYLEKIFTENRVTPYILHLFFKFFPNEIFYFYLNLDQKSTHIQFLERMIESLKLVDYLLSFETLKNIFSSGNYIIKLKTLKAMQHLSEYDKNFLIPIIKKGDLSLKKEAFEILARDERSRQEAFKNLFSIFSPFGIRNSVLHRNIRVIEDKDYKEKEEFLTTLSRKKFFWNRKLREHAQRVLEK